MLKYTYEEFYWILKNTEKMGIYLEVDVLHKKKAKIFKKAPNQNIKTIQL